MELTPTRRRRFLAAAAAMLAAIPVVLVATANASVPTTPAGWSLAWSDDFNGTGGTLPSSANWTVDLGHAYPGGPANWGTGEVQNYTNSTDNLKLDGAGNLRITALRDGSNNWTSARIETKRGDFRPPSGGKVAMEARIQMPNVTGNAALGYWPAFWALGSPYRGNYWNWPGIGEFDIMENVNGINSVWGVLHCGVNPGGPCNETTGLGANRACPGSSCQSAFHTYRFEWDQSSSPQAFRWYVDGQQFHSVTQNQLPADTWANMTNHAGYFILLNLAIGGAFPNALAGSTPTAATVSGHSLVVDYVAVYTAGGGGTTPTTTTTTPPSGAAAGSTPTAASRRRARPRAAVARSRPPATPVAARTSARSPTAARCASPGCGSAAPRRRSSPPASPPVRAAVSAVWSRPGWTARRARWSAASRSATPAAGRAGGPSPRTCPA